MSDESLRELARIATAGDADARAQLQSEVSRSLVRVVRFRRAYCEVTNRPSRGENDTSDYGKHSVEMWLGVRGPLGAASLIVYSGWDTKRVRAEQTARWLADEPQRGGRAMVSGLSVCVPVAGDGKCLLLGCNCDRVWSSSLNAEPVFDLLTDHGEDAAYEALATKYVDVLYMGEIDTMGKLRALPEELP